MSYGFASHVGIGKETVWATAVAASDYFEALSESIVTQRERYQTRNIVGAYYEPDDSDGIERNAGDLQMAVNAANIGHILLGGFGQNSVTEVLSGFLYTNEFVPRQSDISSLHPLDPYTFEIFRAGTLVNTAFQYAGSNIGRLTMDLRPNQALQISAGIIAKQRNMIAKTTPSFPGSPVEPFKFDTASLELPAGTANVRIEALTAVLDNQLVGIPAINNSQNIAKIRRNGPPMVRISGTIDFSDLTEFDDFIARTEQALKVTLTRADSFALVLEVPRLIYTAVPLSVPGRDRLVSTFEGMGRYHTGSANAFKATLTTTNTY